MTREYNYDTVLLGATFYSAAYAIKGNDCLIIDRRSVVGNEFAAALKASPCKMREYLPITQKFMKRLTDNGILCSDGRLQIVATSLELASFMFEALCDVLLETEIISVEKNAQSYSICIFNRDGYQTVTAKNVIDTRCISHCDSYNTLGLLLAGGDIFPTVPDKIGFMYEERNNKEPIFHLYLDNSDTIMTAKDKMSRLIENTDYFKGWQACSIAPSFATHYPKGIVKYTLDNGVKIRISSSYGNILDAMEGGEADAAADNLQR